MRPLPVILALALLTPAAAHDAARIAALEAAVNKLSRQVSHLAVLNRAIASKRLAVYGDGTIEVRNAAGTVVAKIGHSTSAGGYLAVNSRAGKAVVAAFSDSNTHGQLRVAAGAGATMMEAGVNGRGGYQHLRNASGKVVVSSYTSTRNSRGYVATYDASGRAMSELGAGGAGGYLTLRNTAGAPVVEAFTNIKNGHGFLAVKANSKTMASMGVGKTGGHVTTFNGGGKRTANLATEASGRGSVNAFDGGGRPRAMLTSDRNGGRLQLDTGRGVMSSVISVDGNGDGQLFVSNRAGKLSIFAGSDPGGRGLLTVNNAAGKRRVAFGIGDPGGMLNIYDVKDRVRAGLNTRECFVNAISGGKRATGIYLGLDKKTGGGELQLGRGGQIWARLSAARGHGDLELWNGTVKLNHGRFAITHESKDVLVLSRTKSGGGFLAVDNGIALLRRARLQLLEGEAVRAELESAGGAGVLRLLGDGKTPFTAAPGQK